MHQSTQNIWLRYGFVDNPFDTRALSHTSNFPIGKAYVKRKNYNEIGGLFDYFLRIPNGGRIIVEGDSGVGKTTFVNFHKASWRGMQTREKLFSPETEISVNEDWNIENFIFNALGSLVGQIRLDIGERKFNKHKFLKEILSFSGVLFQTIPGISTNIGIPTLFSVGGSVSKTTSVTIGKNIESQLQQYLNKTIEFIMGLGYRGVILHFNNMELLQHKNTSELKGLFEGIRDVLQTANIYFVFIGGKGLYNKIIMPNTRVRSIFYDEPIVIPALDLENLKEIIDRRYKLSSKRSDFVKPVSDGVLEYLHTCFGGRIRDIMNTITNLISRIPEGVIKTITLDEVKPKLLAIEEQKLRRQDFSETEIEFLKVLLELDKFSNSELASKLGKSKQYINKYLSEFRKNEVIVKFEKMGRNIIYTIHPRFTLLKALICERDDY